jgi:hypothetical protein
MTYTNQFSIQVPALCLVNVYREFPKEVAILASSELNRLIANCVYYTDSAIAKMRASSSGGLICADV